MFKIVFRVMQIVITILALVSFYFFIKSPSFSVELYNGTNKESQIIDVKKNTIRSITIDEAYTLYNSEKFKNKAVIFMDIRPESVYEKGHIDGAIPHVNSSIKLDLYLSGLDKNTIIVLYGSDLNSGLGKGFINPLLKSGYDRVLYFADGFREWTYNQYPISFGKWH